MRLLKVVGLIVLLVAVLVGGLLASAPWLDGPILHIAGGPFKQASVDYAELDPAILNHAGMIEIEVKGISRPSITIGVLVLSNNVYIPATLRPEEKRWPVAIETDPRIRIRFNGIVVDALAHKVDDRDLHLELSELGAQKYQASYFEPERTWYFKVSPVVD